MDDNGGTNPQVRIAEALEGIARILVQLANPPTVMRSASCCDKDFVIPGNIDISSVK